MDVLIADDSELTLDRMAAEIANLPNVQHVWKVRDGKSALDGIKQNKPHVVILDIKMPGRNGLEVLKEVKSWPSPPVVIIYTFYAYPQHKERALGSGADYYFDKTKNYHEIFNALRELGEKIPI